MIVSFEINDDEEAVYKEAGIISGESFSDMAKDGAWMRINDILRDSRRETTASRTSKVIKHSDPKTYERITHSHKAALS